MRITKLAPRSYAVLAVSLVVLIAGAAAWYNATATLGVEDKYAADVIVPTSFHATSHKSFPWRAHPAIVWNYQVVSTPGGIIQSLNSALIGSGFHTTTTNGTLSATNEDLKLNIGISRAAQNRAFTVAITATEAK